MDSFPLTSIEPHSWLCSHHHQELTWEGWMSWQTVHIHYKKRNLSLACPQRMITITEKSPSSSSSSKLSSPKWQGIMSSLFIHLLVRTLPSSLLVFWWKRKELKRMHDLKIDYFMIQCYSSVSLETQIWCLKNIWNRYRCYLWENLATATMTKRPFPF